jgi:VWFA-related protein
MDLRCVALPALGCLVASLASVPSLGAQEPETGDARVLPPASVEVVRIEVAVTEKGGRARTGLRREDFVVLEDGKPQPIVQFHAFDRTVLKETPATPAPPGPAPVEEDEAEELLPARYVVLVIDDVHMEFPSLARFRKALERFIDEDLQPEDQVALITTSGASALSQEFTADRDVLRETLSRLSPKGRQSDWTGVPHITEYQAELIEAGDPFALDAAVQEVMNAGLFQDPVTAEAEARGKSNRVLTEAVYNSRLTLEVLDSVCRGLSGLTGRKTLFLISDGFLTGLAAKSGAGFDVRRIADAATRAGVVIYALDTRGLVATPTAMSASSATRVGTATAGTLEAIQQRSQQATRDAMNAVAEDTGGFLVESSNNLRFGLRKMLKDTETYYVLAYEPTNTKRDGGFRKIEVRLPGVRGVKVRARSGYFAPDDSRLRAAEGTAEAEARRAEQRTAEMRTALNALAPLTAIPVHLSADFLSPDQRATQIIVSGSVGVSTLPFVRLRDHRQATIESVALVYDEAGAVVATLPTERSAMDLSDADYQKLLGRGLPYQGAVALPPGRYQVRLAAREDATGLLGSAWQRIEIPDLAAGRLSLSSLFLLKDAGTKETAGGAEGAPALMNSQALRRFDRSEGLYVQFQAYNPKRNPSGATDLVSQAEVLRDGVLLGTAAPEPFEQGAAQGPLSHTSRIKLDRFEPGDYELRVTVTDRTAGALTTRAVTFTVE